MKRRTFLGALGGTSVAIGSGLWVVTRGDDGTAEASPQPVENPPEKIEKVRPLAKAFKRRIMEHYPNSRVGISNTGTLGMEFSPDVDSAGELKTTLHRVALEYARVVESEEATPVTLSIVTGKVEAIVPKPSLTAYLDDDLNKKAFLQTVEVRDIERNETPE
jgi:hypothetical protein